MNEAPLEAAAVGCGNMVAALLHALSHAGDGVRGAGEPEVMQFDFVAESPGALLQTDVGLAAQGALQRECFPAAQALVHLGEQQTRGTNCGRAGFERRKPARDFIRVQEAQALHFLRQKLFRERGLACAVAAGDDVNGW